MHLKDRLLTGFLVLARDEQLIQDVVRLRRKWRRENECIGAGKNVADFVGQCTELWQLAGDSESTSTPGLHDRADRTVGGGCIFGLCCFGQQACMTRGKGCVRHAACRTLANWQRCTKSGQIGRKMVCSARFSRCEMRAWKQGCGTRCQNRRGEQTASGGRVSRARGLVRSSATLWKLKIRSSSQTCRP